MLHCTIYELSIVGLDGRRLKGPSTRSGDLPGADLLLHGAGESKPTMALVHTHHSQQPEVINCFLTLIPAPLDSLT